MNIDVFAIYLHSATCSVHNFCLKKTLETHARAFSRTRKQFQNGTRMQVTFSLFYVAALTLKKAVMPKRRLFYTTIKRLSRKFQPLLIALPIPTSHDFCVISARKCGVVECVRIRNIRDFPQAKLDREINACFL